MPQDESPGRFVTTGRPIPASTRWPCGLPQWRRISRPDLDHLPAGHQAGRAGSQGRKRLSGCLRQQHHPTEHDDATGEDTEREIPFLKGYTVFNVEQIDGLPAIYCTKAAPALDSVQRIEGTETFVAATRATVRHGGNRAYYAQELDYVQMPPFEAFRDAESYYGAILHELVHSTKHPSRLDRDLGRKSWGDAGYAAEELVAELGSAFLCADLRAARGKLFVYLNMARSPQA